MKTNLIKSLFDDSDESSELDSDESTELDSETKRKNRLRRRQKVSSQKLSSKQIVENQNKKVVENQSFDLKKMVENAINTRPDLQQRQESKYFYEKEVSTNYRQTKPNRNPEKSGKRENRRKPHRKLTKEKDDEEGRFQKKFYFDKLLLLRIKKYC